jgi:peptide/nickel transport system permease protein
VSRAFVQRLLLVVPTIWGTVTLVFFLVHLVPGDPVEVMLGETAAAANKQELRRALGLDQPLFAQYRNFLLGVLHGNLGRSIYEQAAVEDLIRARLPVTIELTLYAMAVALMIAFPLAVAAALNRGGWIDRLALLLSLLGVSMPSFWLGPLLMIVFSIQLGWLPVSGVGGIAYAVLPSLSLGLGMAAILMRMLRSNLLMVGVQDYIRTARAKGLSEKRVWLKHMLRNALLSVITIMSLQFGALLAGAIITETIFSWPGVGRLTVQAIQTRDYPLVQGCVLTIAVAYVLVNFVADVLYHVADPRITYE